MSPWWRQTGLSTWNVPGPEAEVSRFSLRDLAVMEGRRSNRNSISETHMGIE